MLRLEKLPMELLILLLERHGELVSREQIAQRLWGDSVFLDLDHSINTAVRKVRRALKDDPDKPRFVETVVGKGYRFAATITHPNGQPTKEAGSPPDPSLSPPTRTSALPAAFTRFRVLAGCVTLLAIVALGLLLMRITTASPTSRSIITSLAVLPLKNLSGDPSQEYFADGMTEAVIGRLSMIGGLRVISRTSVMRYKKTDMSLPEIAKALRVDGLVEGSVIRDGDHVRVSVRLIRGATEQQLWSDTYDRQMQDVLLLQSEVAQSIARQVEVTVTGGEQARLVSARNVSPDVYESYLKGEFAKNNSRREIETSISYFQDAIQKDPTFAPAYIGLAAAYDELGTVFAGEPPGQMRAKATAAAQKALELDPSLGDAHTVLAGVYQEQWKWNEAAAEYKAALDLNPNDAAARDGFANWLLCQGRMEEALAWIRRARELDPVGVSGSEMGWFLFHAHHYNQATKELRSMLKVRPDDASALLFLGFVLDANRQPDQAVPILEKALSLSGGSPAVTGVLIRAYAHAGQRADALRLLDKLKLRRQNGYVPAAAFVNAYLGLDDKENAFFWLEKAYEEQSNILQFLKVHPYFDLIRDDPRFVDLVRRVGLAAENQASVPLR